MKYPNGLTVEVGDKVELWEGCHGRVVASMDTSEYGDDYPAEEWAYLKKGVLIESDAAGLIHYLRLEETTKLLERRTPKSGSSG